MDFNKFTIKAQEAIQEAVKQASSHGQQVIEPAHIMEGVLTTSEQIVSFLMQKTGVSTDKVKNETEKIIATLPRVSGGEPYLSRESNNILTKAEEIAGKNGDEFVSVEPLLLALLEVKSAISDMLKENGLTRSEMEKAINEGSEIPVTISASDLCEIMKAQLSGGYTLTDAATGAEIKWESTGYVNKAAIQYVIKEAN